MAHSGDGTGWNTAVPANSEPVYKGALEIRDLRKALELRTKKEHIKPAASSVGLEHKHGSAKAYSQAAAPTKYPDGTTADGEGGSVFTSADVGRLWHDTDDDSFHVLVDESGPVWAQLGMVAGTVMWFYANTAPTYWTIVSAIGDELLAIKGGTTYTTGGAVAGAWTHNHSGNSGVVTLTAAQSGRVGHTHVIGTDKLSSDESGAGKVTVGGSGTEGGAITIDEVADANAASSHKHTVAAETAYRPDARVGILCTKD